MTDSKEHLACIKAGDEVVWQWGNQIRIVRVDKRTPTQIVIGQDRYRLDGRIVGRHSADAPRITQVTKALRRQAEEYSAKSERLAELRRQDKARIEEINSTPEMQAVRVILNALNDDWLELEARYDRAKKIGLKHLQALADRINDQLGRPPAEGP